MPISPGNFPALQQLSNGEDAESIVFNRPLFALSTRTNSLRSLLEDVEGEVVDARGAYATLQDRLDGLTSTTATDRNIFITGGSITWSVSSQTLTYSELVLVQPDQSFNYTITAGSTASIADNEALYVTLSRNAGAATLALVKAALGSVPNTANTYVVAVRRGDRLWVRHHGEFENEETRELGDGTTTALLGRLGMVNDRDSDSHFTNTTFILVGDNIPAAVSKHDRGLEYLTRDRNVLLHGGGNVSWNISGSNGTLAFDGDFIVTVPSVGDITVSAGSVGTIVDNEVLYFSFMRTGSSYTKTLLKSDSASLPLAYGDTDNFVIGYRNGTNFIFRSGDVFQDGETKVIGTGGAGLVTYQNMSLYASSDDDVSWDATSGQLDCVGDITIQFPWETFSNVIASTEFPIILSTSSKKAYVVLDRSQQASLTVVDDIDKIPITYSQPDVLLVAERIGNSAYVFGSHRYNDGDIRRIGEGFVAGAIYDQTYVVSTSGVTTIVLPNGGTHGSDDVTLKVWGNGNFLYPNVQYTEGPGDTQITAAVSEMFPAGEFTPGMRLRFRIESIVTGGAGPGGAPGGGIAWSDPIDSSLVPDTDDTYNVGSGTKGFRAVYLSDRVGNGDVYELYVNSGSLQIVKV